MTELRSAGPGVSSVETLSFIHRMPFGPCPANGIDDSQGYLFRLYAPAAGQVEVLLATADGHEDAHPCRRTDDGWWTRTVPYARTGDRYRYRVDGTGCRTRRRGPIRTTSADPASWWTRRASSGGLPKRSGKGDRGAKR